MNIRDIKASKIGIMWIVLSIILLTSLTSSKVDGQNETDLENIANNPVDDGEGPLNLNALGLGIIVGLSLMMVMIVLRRRSYE
jgi:hypothetical protein